MKHVFTSAFLLLSVALFAQSPEEFNYQGVARDNDGNVLENQSIALQLSILSGSMSGTVEYVETHAATTNDFGLFNVSIGGGTPASGSFAAIGWGSNSHYVKVEMDPAGGTAYATMGTSQLLSVPYALHAKNAGPAGTDGQTLRHNGTTWEATSSLFNDGTQIGVGTTAPAKPVHISTGDSPALRLEQDGTSWPAQTWDIAGNESSFFVRDQTNGTLPLQIQPGAPSSSIRIAPDGKVGVGQTNPAAELDVSGQVKITGGAPGVGKVLTSDADGLATWEAGNPQIGFRATNSSSTAVPTNTTYFVYETEVFDDGSNYNNTTGIFTAPSDGLYYFEALLDFDPVTASNYISFGFQVNVSGFRNITNAVPSSTLVWMASANAVIKLSAGDEVKVRIFNGAGSPLTPNANAFYNCFSGYKIY